MEDATTTGGGLVQIDGPTPVGGGPRPIEPDELTLSFRQVFRRHAAGVAVVTVAGREPDGFTVTSLASVSVAPPLLSFNVTRHTPRWRSLVGTGRAAVHLLGEDQAELAVAFAAKGVDRLAQVDDWSTGPYGLPLLTGVLACLVVEVRHQLTAGDHAVVIGEVIQADHTDARPLIYLGGRYATVAD